MPGQIKIFVSYAHADFRNWPGYEFSRARLILDQMIQALGANDGRLHFKVVMDTRNLIKPSDNIDAKISEAVDDCDIGLAFLSESYCNSPECEREFDMLSERSDKPFFLVELEDVWSEAVIEHRLTPKRPNIDRLSKVSFWGMIEDRAIPYGFPLPNEDPVTKTQYRAALVELVGGIKLRGTQILRQKQEIAAFSEPPPRPFVFVALATPDVRGEAEKLLRHLRAAGYGVYMPNEESDLSLADFSSIPDHLDKVIAECDFYVQLFGGTPGREILGTGGKRLAELQFEVAAASAKPMVLWQSRSFDAERADQNYVQFLRRTSPHILSYEEFELFAEKEIAKRFAAINAEQKRIAKATEAPVAEAATAAAPTIRTVAIDAAPEDASLSQMLSEALQTHVGVDNVDYEPSNDSLRDVALQNDAVILVWGGSQAGWKRTRAHLNLFRRYAGPDGMPPKKAIGNAAPPPPEAPPCPTGPDVSVMRVKDQVDPAALAGFLAQLGIGGPQQSSS